MVMTLIVNKVYHECYITRLVTNVKWTITGEVDVVR